MWCASYAIVSMLDELYKRFSFFTILIWSNMAKFSLSYKSPGNICTPLYSSSHYKQPNKWRNVHAIWKVFRNFWEFLPSQGSIFPAPWPRALSRTLTQLATLSSFPGFPCTACADSLGTIDVKCNLIRKREANKSGRLLHMSAFQC